MAGEFASIYGTSCVMSADSSAANQATGTTAAASGINSSPAENSYEITIHTSDIMGAGKSGQAQVCLVHSIDPKFAAEPLDRLLVVGGPVDESLCRYVIPPVK